MVDTCQEPFELIDLFSRVSSISGLISPVDVALLTRAFGSILSKHTSSLQTLSP